MIAEDDAKAEKLAKEKKAAELAAKKKMEKPVNAAVQAFDEEKA